jgi:acid phosphatase
MAIPNICHDAHDCSLGTADRWLHHWLPRVFAGPDFRSGRLAVMVTFDENDGAPTNTVLTVVISPHAHHVTANASYSDYSWLRCADSMLQLPPLRRAASARSLCLPFKL